MTIRSGEPADGLPRPALASRPGTSSVALFLSLSLLLLAFFIVLNALSTTEDTRVQAVMGSLSRTFADGTLPEGTRFTGAVGPVVADSKTFEAALTDLIASTVPAAEVRQDSVSGITEVTMRADALFDDFGTELRAPRRSLLDRLVAALAIAPPGVAITMEFTLGTDYDSSRTGGSGDGSGHVARQRGRAAAMAEAMVKRGVSPKAFAVGLEAGLGDQVRMRFRMVEMTDGPLTDGMNER